ncbi:MAG: fibronectin type III domain-containing protein, partial [Candidatus Coatesbacteria bacterium]|nr:fibronectin type III domain-containing protein [Candidatus Coatesbacteria bacterium]
GCCEPYEGTDAEQGASPIRVFDSTSIDLTGLDNEKTYHISVTSVDACTNECDYSPDEHIASPEELIDAPTLATIVAGDRSALVEWSAPENLFVRGYRVHYRSIDASVDGGKSGQETIGIDVGPNRSYTIRGLENGTQYEVFITAYDEHGRDGLPSALLIAEPSSDVDWFQVEPAGPTPSPRFNHQTVLDPTRKRIYLLGGTADYEEEGILYYLDLEKMAWEIIETSGLFPPFGRCLAHFDSVRDCIWMLAFDRDVYQLILSDHSWVRYEPVGDAPIFDPSEGTPLIGSGFLDARRDRLLYYGAFMMASEADFRTDFYAFDLDTHVWSTHQSTGASPSFVYLTAIAYAEQIDRAFLFGGFGEDGVSSSIYMMEPASLTWISMPVQGTLPMETYIHDMQYDPSMNRIITFGGRTRLESVSNEIYSYDIDGQNWTDLEPILTGIPRSPLVRTPLTIVPSGLLGPYGYMVIICGYDYQEMFNDVYCLRLYDFTKDRTPPSRVDDLNAEVNDEWTHTRLTWTAPGDDGALGRARGYDIRLSTTEIKNDVDFELAFPVLVLYLPSFPGEIENLLFELPQPNTVYYLALKAFDEAGNYSELSNCVSTQKHDARILHEWENDLIGSDWQNLIGNRTEVGPPAYRN